MQARLNLASAPFAVWWHLLTVPEVSPILFAFYVWRMCCEGSTFHRCIVFMWPSVLETTKKSAWNYDDMIELGKQAGQELKEKAGPDFFNW